MARRTRLALLSCLVAIASPASLAAQDSLAERASAIATADAALAAITRGQMGMLADLMLPQAIAMSVGERNGEVRYNARMRETIRASRSSEQVVERGWNPEARVSGPVAVVWYPYDLYLDGKWSHCGADIFSLVKYEGKWRIASLVWSVLQPPACDRHPQGPPKGATP